MFILTFTFILFSQNDILSHAAVLYVKAELYTSPRDPTVS